MYETFSFGEDPKLPEFGGNSATNNEESEKGVKTLEEEGSADLLKALERGARLPCPFTCSQEVYVKVMYPCWHIDSHQRPDFAKLCKDIKDLINNEY
jgi:Janus kinase 2